MGDIFESEELCKWRENQVCLMKPRMVDVHKREYYPSFEAQVIELKSFDNLIGVSHDGISLVKYLFSTDFYFN